MKKFFFYTFLILAIGLFCLLSCARTDCLYDVVASVTAADTSLPAGSILCYGRQYANAVTDDTLSDYLGLGGYPEFKDKMERMQVSSHFVEWKTSVQNKGTGGKVDYDNPEFRMMINASAGGPLRSMQISGGIKGGVIPGMLEMANGHFFKGILKMITG